MNKIMTIALVAAGLLLLDIPEAAAHSEIRFSYQPSAHYRYEHRRADHMPYWLMRDKAFRKWYRHSRLRHNRHLAWHRLFDIYRWEQVARKQHRRNAHFAAGKRYQRHDHRVERRRDKH